MKKLEELKAELAAVRKQAWEIEKQIREMADGFTYHVCVSSYGSHSWSTCKNPVIIQELCDEYGDGYDGLVQVFTDNPNLEVNEYGCLQLYSLDELPEVRRNVSKSEAQLNRISALMK